MIVKVRHFELTIGVKALIDNHWRFIPDCYINPSIFIKTLESISDSELNKVIDYCIVFDLSSKALSELVVNPFEL